MPPEISEINSLRRPSMPKKSTKISKASSKSYLRVYMLENCKFPYIFHNTSRTRLQNRRRSPYLRFFELGHFMEGGCLACQFQPMAWYQLTATPTYHWVGYTCARFPLVTPVWNLEISLKKSWKSGTEISLEIWMDFMEMVGCMPHERPPTATCAIPGPMGH